MSLKKKAFSGAKWASISSFSVNIFSFIKIAILAHILLPKDFGLMALVSVVLGFGELFSDMGIGKAIIQKQGIKSYELSSLYWFNIIIGTALYVLILSSTPFVVSFYNEPMLKGLIPVATLGIVIASFGLQFNVLFLKKFKFQLLAYLNISSSLIGFFAAVSLAFLGYGVWSLVLGSLVSTIFRTLFLVIKGIKQWHPKLHFVWTDLSAYIRFGLYQTGQRILTYFYSNIDYLIIGALLGTKSLGYYTIAFNLIIKPLKRINPIFNNVSFPIFSKIQNELLKLKKGYFHSLYLQSIILLPIFTGIVLIAPILVPVILGENWKEAIPLIQILSIVGFLRCIVNSSGSVTLAVGRADLAFKYSLISIISYIPFIYIGAKLHGLVGVAFAIAFLQVLLMILHYYMMLVKSIGPCFKEYFSSLWPSLKISIILAISIVVSGKLLNYLPDLYLLSIQTVVGIITFFIAIKISEKMFANDLKMLFFGK